MDNAWNWAVGAAAVISGGLTWIFGPWDTVVMVLLAFVAADYLAGVVNALLHKELSSEIGWKGLLRKAMIFLAVAMGALLDKIVPSTNGAIRAAVCIFYIANEGLSIIENMAKMGVPMPEKLREVLAQLRDKGEA